jgi:hypothetical protein
MMMLHSRLNLVQINTALSTHVIPLLPRLLLEQDKVATVCTNLIYYIVSPSIRSNSGSVPINDP